MSTHTCAPSVLPPFRTHVPQKGRGCTSTPARRSSDTCGDRREASPLHSSQVTCSRSPFHHKPPGLPVAHRNWAAGGRTSLRHPGGNSGTQCQAEITRGQGCPGGRGGLRGGGPPGLLEACREGGLRPGPRGAPRSSTGGEGQVMFFAEAGILTSDFPCSAWGRSWQCWVGTAGGAGRAGAWRLPGTQSSRPEGSAGPSLTVPGPGLPTLGCLAHPGHRPACDFLIPAGALLSHTGLR